MFREFFCSCSRHRAAAATAWAGLVVVFAYAIFLAFIKTEINRFYTEFYDLMQEAGSVAFRLADGRDEDDATGSGVVNVPDVPLAEYRARVWAQLLAFAGIVAPLIVVAPVAKWARSVWAFAWRQALMRAYLERWDISKEPIEGASQRLHEARTPQPTPQTLERPWTSLEAL